MASYSASELRYARPLANALLVSGLFRQWFFSGTRHENDVLMARPLGDLQLQLRSPGIKNPYWFNYWCGKDKRCSCRVGTGIETDILLLWEVGNARRLALHIEVKRPGDCLGDGQAESYPRRAACWSTPATKPQTVPAHDQYATMLVCGPELAADSRCKWFDKVLFHGDIAKRIAVYPEA